MTLTIEQVRTAFKQKENENSRPNNYYPFWTMPEGASATIRFLPDANPDNPMGFLVEKIMHTLTINGENKSVPCLKMYGEECPVCKVSSAYYKEGDKVNGKKYWRKKQHLTQVQVVEDPTPPDQETGENHEGKVRFLAIGYQLFNILKEAFESGELDIVPYAFKGGTNFVIKKSKQGDHASYVVGSKFSRRSTDLTDDEIAEVKDHMIDLSTLLPQHPGVEKVEAMLEAALTGAEFSDGGSSTPASEPESEPESDEPASKSVEDKKPAAEGPSEFADEADEILAKIRERQKNKAQ